MIPFIGVRILGGSHRPWEGSLGAAGGFAPIHFGDAMSFAADSSRHRMSRMRTSAHARFRSSASQQAVTRPAPASSASFRPPVPAYEPRLPERQPRCSD